MAHCGGKHSQAVSTGREVLQNHAELLRAFPRPMQLHDTRAVALEELLLAVPLLERRVFVAPEKCFVAEL